MATDGRQRACISSRGRGIETIVEKGATPSLLGHRCSTLDSIKKLQNFCFLMPRRNSFQVPYHQTDSDRATLLMQ
eukprot:scaffold12700_cov142-Skeletonema_menzelii.AAC.7